MNEMAEAKNRLEQEGGEALDDRGTDTAAGREILKRLRDGGFDADNEKLATALGRPVETVEAWMQGAEPLDDDIIIKARGLATERGIEVE
jgi:hypothetical protein